MGTRHKNKSKTAFLIIALLLVVAISAVVGYFHRHPVAVLDPAGTIGRQERGLMLLAAGLCAIVVIPVFLLTTAISLKYREGNKKPKRYSPNWSGNRAMELTWWGIPFAIITILAVVAWTSSYRLDPYRALASNVPPLKVQVISMDWKWLFIYPDQNVASINYLKLPINTPVDFEITSDSVMNSFWIPNLGGQIYAMPGMSTELHLSADKIGNYRGGSANISGSGFARMNFTAAVSSPADFNRWAASARRSPFTLSLGEYHLLTMPSTSPVAYFSRTQPGLYDYVVEKYMTPPSQLVVPHAMEGM